MCTNQTRFRRRGAAIAMVAVSSAVLLGFAALAIDMGMVYGTRTEVQRSADAGALAGVSSMLSEDRLKGPPGVIAVLNTARQASSVYAHKNKVFGSNPTVDQTGDVTLGRLSDPINHDQDMKINVDPSQLNAVKVMVHRDTTRNGPIPLLFAQIFGFSTKNMSASATAIIEDAVIGFKTPGTGDNVQILPITIVDTVWKAYMDGNLWYAPESGDGWTYNTTSKAVGPGPDQVKELNIWPGGGLNQLAEAAGGGTLLLTPGNFGTVLIGRTNNSTADLSDQIRYGVTAEQMAMYPNSQLTFGTDGTLSLTGDPGMSDGIKDDLAAIIGQKRIIPIFKAVSGTGANTVYTIVAWGGVRIMAVSLKGDPGNRYVAIQPAVLSDGSVVTGGTSGRSYNIYRPPTLAR